LPTNDIGNFNDILHIFNTKRYKIKHKGTLI